MNPFQVLWFDPGGKTGYAICKYKDEELSYYLGTFRNPEHHHEIRQLIQYCHEDNLIYPLTVGTESFTFRKSPGSAEKREGLELISREYIGVMKLVCGDIGIELKQQMPSIMSSLLVDNDHLAALGLLPPPPLHDNKDQIAATRHLIYYLIRTLKVKHPLTTAFKEL